MNATQAGLCPGESSTPSDPSDLVRPCGGWTGDQEDHGLLWQVIHLESRSCLVGTSLATLTLLPKPPKEEASEYQRRLRSKHLPHKKDIKDQQL